MNLINKKNLYQDLMPVWIDSQKLIPMIAEISSQTERLESEMTFAQSEVEKVLWIFLGLFF